MVDAPEKFEFFFFFKYRMFDKERDEKNCSEENWWMRRGKYKLNVLMFLRLCPNEHEKRYSIFGLFASLG
jgi:hypothetical protein